MPFSRLVRMRSRTSAMSASRSIGSGSPMWPKSNDGAEAARPAHRVLGARPRLRADRRGGADPRATRADRVVAFRRCAAEAALMHAVLVGAHLVLEVIAGAIDRDGHGAVRRETRERPKNAIRARRLDDPRFGLLGEAR